MIDAKKVRMMTKLAVYEEGDGRKELKMNRFSRNMYLSYKQLESFIAVTIAYILGAALYGARYYTEIMAKGFDFPYKDILIKIIIGYILVNAASILITGRIARKQYDKMQRHLKEYDRQLYHLSKYLEHEEISK